MKNEANKIHFKIYLEESEMPPNITTFKRI